jgi:hypothetical protein
MVDTNHAQDIHPVTTADFHVFIWILWQTDRNVDWDIYGSFYLAGGAEEGIGNKCPVTMYAHPNPFQDRINFSVVHGVTSKELKIYDSAGRMVKILFLPTAYSLLPTVVWDGSDQSGRPVPPGVYFVRTAAGSSTIQEKIIRLR